MVRGKLSAAFLAACLGAVCAASPLAVAPAHAAQTCDGRPDTAERDGLVSLEAIVESLNARWPGRMLDACLDVSSPERPIYRVAWLSEGRKMDLLVDARTGSILDP